MSGRWRGCAAISLALGIERAEGEVEPEDHAAIFCEIMSGLASRRFPAPAGSDEKMFEKSSGAVDRALLHDLERAEAAKFYRAVGTLGRTFIDIETEAVPLPS